MEKYYQLKKEYGSTGGAELIFFEVIEPITGLALRKFEAAVSRY